jgi:hypothetical protein
MARRPGSALRLLAAGLAVWISACLDAEPDRSGDIAAAKERWRRNEPDRYSYSVRMLCFCPIDTVRVTATRDSVIEASTTRPGPGGAPWPIPDPQRYSIDSLFAHLEAMEASHPHRLDFRFDPEYGFPDSLVYDGSERAVDDELTQTVFGFRIAP